MFDRFGNPRSEVPPDWVCEQDFYFRQYNDEELEKAVQIADLAEINGGWAVLYLSCITEGNVGVEVYLKTNNSLPVILLAAQ